MNNVIQYILSEFSTPRALIAQIIGFVPLILSFFIFLQKSRKRIIIFKGCSDLLWAIHFFILGEYTGGLVNLVNLLRGIIFAYKGKKWARHILIPIFFCVFTLLSALPTFAGVKSIFAVVGSCVAVVGFWQTNVERLRIYNLVAVTLWLVYGLLTFSISTILCNLFSLVSILIAFIKKISVAKDEEI